MSLLTSENVEEWYRSGHGSVFQFFALDSEIESWLGKYLHPEFMPYDLIWRNQSHEKNPEAATVTSMPVSAFGELSRSGTIDRLHTLWIASRELFDLDEAIRCIDPDRYCSFRGLIMMQLRNRARRRKSASSIGMVNQITNSVSGEIIQNDIQAKIFGRLRRGIKRSLAFTTIQRTIDGGEYENRSVLMSEGVARLPNVADEYLFRPGYQITGSGGTSTRHSDSKDTT